MTRTPLVAGNWKMNGRLALVDELAGALRGAMPEGVEAALCPPYPYLPALEKALDGAGVVLGAQDVCDHEDGAFTGEVSAEMLKELGCVYVIVGHSERRELYGEDDDRVASKFLRAQQAGLTPILCVGETLREREAEQTFMEYWCENRNKRLLSVPTVSAKDRLDALKRRVLSKL